MKIAIVSPMLLPVPDIKGGAVEMLITYLIEENEKNKYYDIDLYTVYDDKLKEYKYENTKIMMKKIPYIKKIIQKVMNKFFNILKINKVVNFSWIKMENEIKKHNYDKIIIENNMFLYRKIYEKKLYNNAKLIYHMHNDINNIDKTEENYKLIEKTAEKIIAISNFIKNRLNSIQRTDKIEVLYNCIDKDLYNNDNINECIESKKIKEYKIKDDVSIGYIGRISKEKGLLELVKAFRNIELPNVSLYVIGSQWYDKIKKDKYYNKILEEIKHIKNNIYFIGNVSKKNMPQIYKVLDIIVIPTICEEAFGMVVLEASLMGKAIIATNSGGMVEIINNNTTGIIVEKDKDIVDNLSNAIKFLTLNKDIRKDFGINAKKEVEKKEEFDKEKYLTNFAKIVGG